MKYVLVVNPVSGKGKAFHAATKLEDILKQRGFEVRRFDTTPKPADLKAFCTTISAQERVVVFGGDGTLNLFFNQASQFEAVSFFGVGTANVVSLEWGLPQEIETFANMLLEAKPMPIRLGVINDQHKFVMMYSSGIDSHILSNVSQSVKNKVGKLAFFGPALKALPSYKHPRMRVILDGQKSLHASWVLVSRFKRYGGATIMAPGASPANEDLQVVLFHGSGIRQTMAFALSAARGAIQKAPRVTIARAHEVQVSCENACPPCQVDGDLYPQKVQKISVEQTLVNFLVPAGFQP